MFSSQAIFLWFKLDLFKKKNEKENEKEKEKKIK